MFIEEIIPKIESYGPRGYFSYETFILNLLKYHLKTQNKPFSMIEDPGEVGKAKAEKGFDSFEGNTLIEIKMSLDRIVMRDQLIVRFVKSEEIHNFKNLLIITYRSIPDKICRRIIEEFKSIYPFLNIYVWGPNEIDIIAKLHKEQALTIANSLFSLRLENAIIKGRGEWEKEREEKLQLLSEYYERGQFTMFLGAGVSSSAGMPDWNTLLNSLFVSYLTKEFTDRTSITDKDIKQIVERLNEIDEPSALMAARYLRKGLSKEIVEIKEFTKTITTNLYKLKDKSKKNNSALITAIASLCMPKRTGAKVKSVITYNFDDLLERQLNAASIQHHSIYTENELYDPDELPIYHVHGFLPEDISKYEGLEKSTLVFSEEGYHQIYSDPYHWSNLVQLTNLRENNCLMVGLSMTDPNLRRLLDISARNIERPRHFAFMRRMSIEAFAYSKSAQGNTDRKLIKNLKGAEQFLNRHHKLNEEIMRELGVSIIWFNDFEEIPISLKQLIK